MLRSKIRFKPTNVLDRPSQNIQWNSHNYYYEIKGVSITIIIQLHKTICYATARENFNLKLNARKLLVVKQHGREVYVN